VRHYRRLRRLVPDSALLRRRAAGETLRELAGDYGVAHTTLGRYFARPGIAKQVKELELLLRRERQAASAQRAVQRRLEREVRRRAKEQRALERQLTVARTVLAAGRPAGRRRSGYGAWLDERDARLPLIGVDLYSRNDEAAASVVAAAGGIEAVIEATGLRTRENVLKVIDPVILTRALDNDAAATAATAAEPVRDRLRRLRPDAELVRRRAAGETLRTLAGDYEVAHTSLCRYLRRPQVARQVRQARRRARAERRPGSARRV
jgi:hypothetical protein